MSLYCKIRLYTCTEYSIWSQIGLQHRVIPEVFRAQRIDIVQDFWRVLNVTLNLNAINGRHVASNQSTSTVQQGLLQLQLSLKDF